MEMVKWLEPPTAQFSVDEKMVSHRLDSQLSEVRHWPTSKFNGSAAVWPRTISANLPLAGADTTVESKWAERSPDTQLAVNSAEEVRA